MAQSRWTCSLRGINAYAKCLAGVTLAEKFPCRPNGKECLKICCLSLQHREWFGCWTPQINPASFSDLCLGSCSLYEFLVLRNREKNRTLFWASYRISGWYLIAREVQEKLGDLEITSLLNFMEFIRKWHVFQGTLITCQRRMEGCSAFLLEIADLLKF